VTALITNFLASRCPFGAMAATLEPDMADFDERRFLANAMREELRAAGMEMSDAVATATILGYAEEEVDSLRALRDAIYDARERFFGTASVITARRA
jgi:hypothetical protein